MLKRKARQIDLRHFQFAPDSEAEKAADNAAVQPTASLPPSLPQLRKTSAVSFYGVIYPARRGSTLDPKARPRGDSGIAMHDSGNVASGRIQSKSMTGARRKSSQGAIQKLATSGRRDSRKASTSSMLFGDTLDDDSSLFVFDNGWYELDPVATAARQQCKNAKAVTVQLAGKPKMVEISRRSRDSSAGSSRKSSNRPSLEE